MRPPDGHVWGDGRPARRPHPKHTERVVCRLSGTALGPCRRADSGMLGTSRVEAPQRVALLGGRTAVRAGPRRRQDRETGGRLVLSCATSGAGDSPALVPVGGLLDVSGRGGERGRGGGGSRAVRGREEGSRQGVEGGGRADQGADGRTGEGGSSRCRFGCGSPLARRQQPTALGSAWLVRRNSLPGWSGSDRGPGIPPAGAVTPLTSQTTHGPGSSSPGPYLVRHEARVSRDR